MSRKDIAKLRGIGRKSAAYLESLLSVLLGDGFRLITHQDWTQPGLPAIAGRPLIEVRST